jgi:antirestriction protein ArdC
MDRERMKAIAQQVAAMSEEQRAAIAARLPVLTIEAHAISARNTCLISLQVAAPVTIIGGFRQWLHHGRAVRKGEKAFYILKPCSKGRKADAPAADRGDQDGGAGLFFVPVPVFDVAQTDPLPAAGQVAA